MSETQIRELLESSGALRDGHFRLSSGLHARTYVQCALLLEQPEIAGRIGGRLARFLEPLSPQVVVSPALGGLIIGYAVAAALSVPFRFTERHGESMALRRGFGFAPGERAVIIEDVVTTGRSTEETIRVVESAGAVVVGIGSIIDRSTSSPFATRPFHSLIELELETWTSENCPECRAGRDLDTPGSRPSTRQSS